MTARQRQKEENKRQTPSSVHGLQQHTIVELGLKYGILEGAANDVEFLVL